MDQHSQVQKNGGSRPSSVVLVIDDEESIVDLITLGLKYEGFAVVAAHAGEEGIATAQRTSPQLIILDRILPDMDGLDVCRRLRANPTTRAIPIVLLTAKDAVASRVEGLNTGADDYLTKPFSFEELVARMRAILRRLDHGSSAEQAQVLTVGEIELNLATHEVTRAGQPIEVTVTEYNLLHLFMSHVGQALDRQTILNQVWGYDFLGETNIIEVYVRYLREKIEESPSAPRYIQTIRGVGYIMKG